MFEGKLRILFVDDDEKILHGLRRTFFPLADRWSLKFALGGRAALQLLEKEPFDVIISDLRMAEIDGVELLQQVKEKYPHIIRFILTGYSSEDSILRTVNIAHQFLSKPCEESTLVQAVEKARKIQRLLEDPDLERLLAKLDHIPSMPAIYLELMEEIKSPNASMKRVGEIISRDIGMTAKILQLVNSAFFGLPKEVTNPTTAVNLLGLNTVMSLVLSTKIFTEFDPDKIKGFSLNRLYQHSMRTAGFARVIGELEELPKHRVDDCFVGSMLHDCGKLLLIGNVPDIYSKVREISNTHKLPMIYAEKQAFGGTHAELGAFLLGSWGLPDQIVDAILNHHSAERIIQGDLIPAIVFFANKFENLLHENRVKEIESEELAETFKQLGIEDKVETWKNRCLEV